VITKQKARSLVAGIAAVVGFSFLAVAPAFAEGARSSYMTDWVAGTRSNTWADSNGDGNSTTVRMENVCYGFRNDCWNSPQQQLGLYRDQWGIGWIHIGNRTANTGTLYNWGNPGSGTFLFQFNGGNTDTNTWTTSFLWRSDPVTISW